MKILLILLMAFPVLAQEESKLKVKEVLDNQRNSVEGDLDQEIQDTKIRAESGSKSRYSASVSFSYYGSSLRKPFDNTRPNVADDTTEAPVSARGSLGLRYRFDKNRSLYLATGYSKDRPFENNEEDSWELSSPMAHYNHTFRFADLQVNSSVMGYVNTLDYLERINQVGTVAYYLGVLTGIGNTRLSAGVSANVFYTFFNDEVGTFGGRTVDVRSRQTDFGYGFEPRIQYRFTDRFNMYTAANLVSYRHTRDRKDLAMERVEVSQTVGAGIAVLRDFYLAPNVSFQPADNRSDNTAVNLTAIVNVL